MQQPVPRAIQERVSSHAFHGLRNKDITVLCYVLLRIVGSALSSLLASEGVAGASEGAPVVGAILPTACPLVTPDWSALVSSAAGVLKASSWASNNSSLSKVPNPQAWHEAASLS